MRQIAGVAVLSRLLLCVLATSALFIALGIFPVKASADVISTQTQQVLPPGGSTCAQLTATGFTPYIYDGALNSFEFTVSDASYVALVGSVGNTGIGFQYMTRSTDASGSLRIHVDIPTTPITGTLPLRVTMLSAHGAGQPVCVSVISTSVGSGPVQGSVSYAEPSEPSTSEEYTSNTPSSSSSGVTNEEPSTGTHANGTSSMTAEPTPIATASAASARPVVGTMQDSLKNLCTSQASAYRLWLVLLVLYALIVGAALWAEFPMSVSWAKTPERIATIILVLLLLLLGFWYFSASCRAALWMPLLAFLIALLGLLAAFWNHPRVTQFLLVEESNH